MGTSVPCWHAQSHITHVETIQSPSSITATPRTPLEKPQLYPTSLTHPVISVSISSSTGTPFKQRHCSSSEEVHCVQFVDALRKGASRWILSPPSTMVELYGNTSLELLLAESLRMNLAFVATSLVPSSEESSPRDTPIGRARRGYPSEEVTLRSICHVFMSEVLATGEPNVSPKKPSGSTRMLPLQNPTELAGPFKPVLLPRNSAWKKDFVKKSAR